MREINPEENGAELGLNDVLLYDYYCPTTHREGKLILPAGELCPECWRIKGHGMNECNFTISK